MSDLSVIDLDVDGVLVDFVSAALGLFGVHIVDGRPAHLSVATWDGMPPLLTRVLGRPVGNEELWHTVDEAGADLWANLDWYSWGRELFSLCESYAPVILMSTPSRHPTSAAGKIDWINSNMPEGWQRRYALTPCKHHMAHAGAALIDDSDSNVAKFREHGGKAFLWPQPWNERRDIAAYDQDRQETLHELGMWLKGLKG